MLPTALMARISGRKPDGLTRSVGLNAAGLSFSISNSRNTGLGCLILVIAYPLIIGSHTRTAGAALIASSHTPRQRCCSSSVAARHLHPSHTSIVPLGFACSIPLLSGTCTATNFAAASKRYVILLAYFAPRVAHRYPNRSPAAHATPAPPARSPTLPPQLQAQPAW